MRRHGDTQYFIPGEGRILPSAEVTDTLLRRRTLAPTSQPFSIESTPESTLDSTTDSTNELSSEESAPEEDNFDEERAFRFSRMFADLPPLPAGVDALGALGQIMEDNFDPLRDHLTIPGGYTYLGQFIDHDITHDPTQGFPSQALTPEQIVNGRTPGLDLDSMYGLGPDDETKAIYEADGMTLRIGNTTPVGGADFSAPNDLPRGGDPANPLSADIGDPRNDENLAVAQTHLAMLKFHNKVLASLPEEGGTNAGDNPGTDNTQAQQVSALMEKIEKTEDKKEKEKLEKGAKPDPQPPTEPVLSRFERARRIVTLHYQWVVLHDFLRRLVQPDILDDVLANGRRFYRTQAEDEPSMPVEFSVAAYRLGHSMIRDSYNWNIIFSESTPDFDPQGEAGSAGLSDLFEFTGLSGGMRGLPTLPSNWIVNWQQMYDFSPALGQHPIMNRVRNIDTHLALTLRNLPDFPRENVPFSSLAVMNLVRGRFLGLPSGQAVAEAMGETALTPQQISTGPHQAILQMHGFDTQTPLWYYLLKEAEVNQDGQTMGTVGSRILAEVFTGLIEASRTSILKEPDWRPTLPARISGQFDMADLLLFVGDLNPLEDQIG